MGEAPHCRFGFHRLRDVDSTSSLYTIQLTEVFGDEVGLQKNSLHICPALVLDFAS